jgi:hypothetical protein
MNLYILVKEKEPKWRCIRLFVPPAARAHRVARPFEAGKNSYYIDSALDTPIFWGITKTACGI